MEPMLSCYINDPREGGVCHAGCGTIGAAKTVHAASEENRRPAGTCCLSRSCICTASKHQAMTHCMHTDADHLIQRRDFFKSEITHQVYSLSG